jgi:HNH endonuclease
MRRLTKKAVPNVLVTNASQWLSEYLSDPSSKVKKYRYRDEAIKSTLCEETYSKCVYCESKIGHNTPGDIEHKVPSSKAPNLHFDWANLTLACTECNRRKSDYYEQGEEFLDPYSDDVEMCLVHLGPLVFAMPDQPRAEITVRILEFDKRTPMFERKQEVLEKARALLSLADTPQPDLLRALRQDEVNRMRRVDAEFSAMVSAYFAQVETKRHVPNVTIPESVA